MIVAGEFNHGLFDHCVPLIAEDDGKLTMTASYDNITYSGRSDEACDYYMEKNGTLSRIHFIKGAINYNLKSIQENNNLEYYESKKQLGTDFGTKKTKALLKNMDKNQVQQGTLDALQKVMSSRSVVNQEIVAPTLSNFNHLLVPFDATTANVEAIYPLDNIVPNDVLNTLEIKQILNVFHDVSKLKNQLSYKCLYTQQRIIRLAKNNQTDVESIRYYLVIDMLIKLYKQSSRHNMNTIQLKKVLYCSDELAEYFMSTFTELTSDEHSKMKYLLTVPMKQKIMNYLLTLVMHKEHFTCVLLNSPSILNNEGVQMEISALLKDLHFSMPKLIERFEWIGCKVRGMSKSEATDMMRDVMICPFKDNKWPALKFIDLVAPLQLKE